MGMSAPICLWEYKLLIVNWHPIQNDSALSICVFLFMNVPFFQTQMLHVWYGIFTNICACPKSPSFVGIKNTSTMLRIWEKVFIRFAIDPTVPGWWFGTWIVFFHLLGMSSSQLTNSYFSEGWLNHQPGSAQLICFRPWRTGRSRTTERNRFLVVGPGRAEKRCSFFLCWSWIFLRAWISNWKKHPGWSLRVSMYSSLEMFINFVRLETFGIEILEYFWVNVKKIGDLSSWTETKHGNPNLWVPDPVPIGFSHGEKTMVKSPAWKSSGEAHVPSASLGPGSVEPKIF